MARRKKHPNTQAKLNTPLPPSAKPEPSQPPEKLLLFASVPRTGITWVIDRNPIRGSFIDERDCFRSTEHIKAVVTPGFLDYLHDDMVLDNPSIASVAPSPDKLEIGIYKLVCVGKLAVNAGDLSVVIQSAPVNTKSLETPSAGKSNESKSSDVSKQA